MTPHPWNLPAWRALWKEPERLPHALLVHGPRGIGKLAFARALAMTLLCQAPRRAGPDVTACGTCPSCHWFNQGSHPDFKLIEPAEAGEDEAVAGEQGTPRKGARPIGIADIRTLGEFLALAAHQGGWRVVVVHPAETMNAAAANALLKTLEEPPARVLIILVAHQPRRLLATVLSRCRKLALPVPDWAQALDWLRQEAPDAPEALLREAGGAPLLALEFADSERRQRRDRFIAALAAGDAGTLSSLAQEYQARPEEAWGWLSRWLHDLMRVVHGAPRYFPEHASTLERLARCADAGALLALDEALRRDGRWLRHPLNGQFLLESWLLRYGDVARSGY